jgi:tRNA-2-methylthio-N6-dimethylallyladenosine synthase
MTTKHVYINTMGCQMNVYDSNQIQNRLAPIGYVPTEDLLKADLVIINTCSIRAKAEQKAFSFAGRLAALKEQKPDLIVGIGGCVAQQEGKTILRRMPYVDLVFGTQAIPRLPRHIERIAATRCRVVDVRTDDVIGADDYQTGPYPQSQVSAFVTIMRGCDNYCTYCVVPYVRGRESSRPVKDILNEIRHLTAHGVREVTLLGQNVNSYGRKGGEGSFAELLASVNDVPGLARIRFTTSHPKDLSLALMRAFRDVEKLCNHMHLPVQSGSDAILRRMNRRYTRKAYLEKIAQLRETRPDIAISTDIIVGFPGETEQDFDETLSLIRHVGYDTLFAFVYSDRPSVPAAKFKGKVEETVQKERLQAVLECQEPFTRQSNLRLLGSVQEVLVEGPGKQADSSDSAGEPHAGGGQQWSGRTRSNKIVHFDWPQGGPEPKRQLTGRLMDIKIEKILAHSLLGSPRIQTDGAAGKGNQHHVA